MCVKSIIITVLEKNNKPNLKWEVIKGIELIKLCGCNPSIACFDIFIALQFSTERKI